MCYALHHPSLGPKGFNWGVLRRPGRKPPHFAADYCAVKALARPQIVEDLRLWHSIPAPNTRVVSEHRFDFEASQLNANSERVEQELLAAGMGSEFASAVGREIGTSFSGMGLWCRLYLDAGDENLCVESRGPDGSPQRSHWQTVMPLLTTAPRPVQDGMSLSVTLEVALGEARADSPVEYSIAASFSPRTADREH